MLSFCCEFSADRQDCGQQFFVLFKLIEICIPNLAVVGSDTNTVVDSCAVCFLVNEIAYHRSMCFVRRRGQMTQDLSCVAASAK